MKIEKVCSTELNEKKKKKKQDSYISYTTGDIGLNIKRFNQAMGTDFNNPSTEEAKAEKAAQEAQNEASGESGEVAASSGDAGNAISEAAERIIKRYYIRPQNIFCSNKQEILQALVKLDGQNCSVYSLKRLDDHDDIHKLTNDDIIYYYDNRVLYDKNHVQVLDYDLSVKGEEKRKKFSRDIKDMPKDIIDKEYKDRLIESALSLTLEDFEAALDAGKAVELGYEEDELTWYDEIDNYFKIRYIAVKESAKEYKLLKVAENKEGNEITKQERTFKSFATLCNAIEKLHIEYPVVSLTGSLEDDAFELTYDAIDAYGRNLTEEKKVKHLREDEELCCICSEPLEGFGNNPEPYLPADAGKCCDLCNIKFVVPARLGEIEADELIEGD